MRQLKMLWVALMAALSLGVVATSVAQAVELKYLPENSSFLLKSDSERAILETLGKKAVECLSLTGGGETTSERLGLVELDFKDCLVKGVGTKCTGLSDVTTGNITLKGEWHLRHLLAPDELYANMVLLISGAHFSCLGVLFLVNGCVASGDRLLDGTESQKEKSAKEGEAGHESFLLNFSQTAGDAQIKEIDKDNSLGMETCELKTKQEAGANESSGEAVNVIVEKCKQGGNACLFSYDLTGTQ